MKALVITPYYYPKIGGLESYARQLNKALASRQQWDIVVVTSTSGWRRQTDVVDGRPVYRLGTVFKLSNTPFNPLWPVQIRRIVVRERPDIIIAHTPVPSMADAAAFACGRTPFVVVNHAATLLKAGSPVFNLAARIYGLMSAFTFRRANRIFAVSPFVRTRLAPALQAKTAVVPNAVWADEITPPRAQPSKAHFVFVAQLSKTHAWKGLAQILEALAIYRSRYGSAVTLTVIGDGDARGMYEQRVQELGLGTCVQFAGWQVGDAKAALIRQAMAMVIYPVTENDAFPTVMLEAWSQHVPVIAARIGALEPLITDGKDGILCAPGNPEALAETLHATALMPAAQREQMAAAAAARTARDYTWERQAAHVAALVKEIA